MMTLDEKLEHLKKSVEYLKNYEETEPPVTLMPRETDPKLNSVKDKMLESMTQELEWLTDYKRLLEKEKEENNE